jgi:hypothetical protein
VVDVGDDGDVANLVLLHKSNLMMAVRGNRFRSDMARSAYTVKLIIYSILVIFAPIKRIYLYGWNGFLCDWM